MATAEELPFWRRVREWVRQHPWWIVLGVLYVLVWWLVPPLLYRYTGTDKAAKLKAITDTRTALLAGVIGVGALLTFWLNSRAYRITVQTLEVTERGQITERFNKAVDHLGSDKLDVRLGGIYALERIARDSDDDLPTVVDLLCAHIRESSPWPPRLPGQGRAKIARHLLRDLPHLQVRAPEVQAALTVLGRLPDAHPNRSDLVRTTPNPVPRTLVRTDLRRAYLRGAHLEGADLNHAHLEGSYMRDVHLEKANLANANLEGASLGGAHLEGATLHASLDGAWLRRAHLEGADLQHADLGTAILTNANLEGADLRDLFLGDADLSGARLEGARANARTVWPSGFDWRAAGVRKEYEELP